MLTLKLLRENPDFVVERLAVKHFDAKEIVEAILEQDRLRRAYQTELDGCLAEQKNKAKEIGGLMKEGKKDEAEAAKAAVAQMKERSKELEQLMEESQTKQNDLLVLLPNLPSSIVPEGKVAEDNVVVKTGGEITDLGENPLPHWDIAKKYDIIDFDLGVKLTGAGFPVYKGKGAKIQRALIQYFLDYNTNAGYMEIEPPILVNEASGFGTGQLPDKEGQMYHAQLDNYYLVPTAEVPVTNIFRDVILAESDFPVMLTAYTPCFRREAGSYGKDVRGLNRLHQFDKVEIVRLSHPDHSYEALDEMVKHVEGLVSSLGLPYRILRLCGGDMSFTSALTYDFEVYSEAQGRWLEVSSVSNFESFQANRLKLRYKDSNGKTNLAHTLNGSSLALPRILAALLENNQTPEGVRVPEVLRPYTGFDMID
ncbi:MAG: serine--tRNA ligase [Bacteroidales bacterium]|nr:serine--tRNA ligase [Bacteroidales bacterium]MBO7321681.1 serine--tRNA ligase [Bacteroidales bacterium]MBO7764598.1 serine--tRNA ligase [Bacteroidales bacterium]MBQ2243699.1 serine--tRNA ligase [Bacteroidales bacterium]